MAMSKKYINGRTTVKVPMSIRKKNKMFESSFFDYTRFTLLVQISQIPSKMCYRNIHMLIGNSTMISSFFYTKIDLAVPYNSAVH